jgi:hypothetical protein
MFARLAVTMCGVSVLLTGCASSAISGSYYYEPSASGSWSQRGGVSGEESLFPSDQAVISNEALATILSAKVALPQRSRIAIIRLAQPRYGNWSEDLSRQDASIQERFQTQLAQSKRVARAAALPSLLLPQKTTVSYLREAAARYQSDLLVVYRVSTRSFDRQKFLGNAETKAYCTIEALLLDTRTGIVLFATSATETFERRKATSDVNFCETIWKAELSATGQALDKVAAELVAFLDRGEEAAQATAL